MNTIESKIFTEDFESFFNEFLSPIQIAIATCDNDSMNFMIHKSTIEDYKHAQYSCYSIPSLLRVLLTKSTLLNEEMIQELFQENIKEFCYILDWGDIKKIIIFSLKNVTLFTDLSFTKELINKRERILELFNGELYEK